MTCQQRQYALQNHLRNRVTSRVLPSNKTPYHLWKEHHPTVSHIRIFGCECPLKIENTPLCLRSDDGEAGACLGKNVDEEDHEVSENLGPSTIQPMSNNDTAELESAPE